MSFGHPLLLLSLLAIPLAVGLWRLAERRRMRYAVRFTNLEVLAQVAGGRDWRRYGPPAVFLVALASLCVALARPNVERLVATERATVILVLDVSGSMEARDVQPTRLGAAQAAMRTFLKRVPKRVRVGLVVFAGEPQVAAPPTTDRDLVRESLDQSGFFPGYGGTAIGDALAAAVELGQQATGRTTGAQTIALRTAAAGTPSPVAILFLSDGSQTRGQLQPADGAARARVARIPVYTIALGTPAGTVTRGVGPLARVIPVPPDPRTLRSIADTTGGQFFAARSAKALDSAYARLGSRLGRIPGHEEVTSWFLAVAAALLVAAGVLSARWSPRLP